MNITLLIITKKIEKIVKMKIENARCSELSLKEKRLLETEIE